MQSVLMKKPCPDCGRRMAYSADECPECACWMDAEAILYVRSAFFVISFLAVFGMFWLLGLDQEVPYPNPVPRTTTTITEPPRAPQP